MPSPKVAEDDAGSLEQALEEVTSEHLKESAKESAIEDDAYEKILVSTPDIVRDVMKEVMMEKYSQESFLDQDVENGNGAVKAAVPPVNSEGSGLGLSRSLSHPNIPDTIYPDVVHASDINVPGGFRRDFIRTDAEDENNVPDAVDTPFVKTLLQDNSAVLYAWIERDLDSDDESDDEDAASIEVASRATPERYEMVFSTYGRRTLHRRLSDFANDESVKSGSRKTVLTLFKCFVATGIMFLPSGFKDAGLFAGSLTLLTIGVISLYGMNLLIQTRAFLENQTQITPRTPLLSSAAAAAVSSTLFQAKPVVVQSYSHLGKHAFGTFGNRLVQTSILFSQIGFCCVYISFIGNTLSNAIAQMFLEKNPDTQWPLWAYLVLTIPAVTPLTFIRHLKHFAIPNAIANVFVLLSISYIVVQAIVHISSGKSQTTNDWSCDPNDKDHTACLWINSATFPMFLGSSVYVFEGITMVIPIQNSMREPEKLPGMLKGVLTLVTVMFVVFGSVNFFAYGQDIRPIVIDNLPKEGSLAVTFMFVLVALFMFPLMAFPAARIIEKKMFKKLRRSGYKWQKNFIRFLIVLFCVLVSIGAGKKVDKLVAIIGGMFCVPLALVYPPLFFIKSGCAQDFWTQLVPAGTLFTVGLLAAILSTTVAVEQFFAS